MDLINWFTVSCSSYIKLLITNKNKVIPPGFKFFRREKNLIFFLIFIMYSICNKESIYQMFFLFWEGSRRIKCQNVAIFINFMRVFFIKFTAGVIQIDTKIKKITKRKIFFSLSSGVLQNLKSFWRHVVISVLKLF